MKICNRFAHMTRAAIVVTVLIVATTSLFAQEIVSGYGDARDPAVLAEMIGEAREEFVLVDVRTPAEFASAHIPSAENIDYRIIGDAMADADRDVPVVVYCRSGNRSARAAQTLESLGFTEVVDFGGIVRWPGPFAQGDR